MCFGDALNQLDFILQSLYRFHRFSLQWNPSITDMTLTWPKDVTKVCYHAEPILGLMHAIHIYIYTLYNYACMCIYDILPQ